MHDFDEFERIVRRAYQFTDAAPETIGGHPFEDRNIHQDLPPKVRELFDDGHYPQATAEAYKYLDEEIQRVSGSKGFGKALMMQVFGGDPPPIAINAGRSTSEKSEQEGFKFLFAGAIQGIGNPRRHSTGISDDPDKCLDHLGLMSLLLRRLDDAGLRQIEEKLNQDTLKPRS